MHVLDAAQARTFLVAVAGYRLEALFTLAITSGLRSAEMLGLRWGNVDLDERSLQVKFSLKRLDGKLALKEGKTEHSRRHIGLTEAAVAALRAHHRRQHEGRLFVGPAWQDRDLVFCMQDGSPMSGIHLLRNQFKPLMRGGSACGGGLPRPAPHCCDAHAPPGYSPQGGERDAGTRLHRHHAGSVFTDPTEHAARGHGGDGSPVGDSISRRRKRGENAHFGASCSQNCCPIGREIVSRPINYFIVRKAIACISSRVIVGRPGDSTPHSPFRRSGF